MDPLFGLKVQEALRALEGLHEWLYRNCRECILENQVAKNMEHEIETGFRVG